MNSAEVDLSQRINGDVRLRVTDQLADPGRRGSDQLQLRCSARIHNALGNRCASANGILLLIVLRSRINYACRRNLFDWANKSFLIPWMFEYLAMFFVVLSIGILIAHTLDAFRS
jgi:hypothetical protein